MHVFLPNSAYPHNFGGFLRNCSFEGDEEFTVSSHPSWVNAHPVTLAAVASLGHQVWAGGGTITDNTSDFSSKHYLTRMGLFDLIGIEPDSRPETHEEAGRFVPLNQIRNGSEMTAFLDNVRPMIRSGTDSDKAISHVLAELIRNVLEHARCSTGAMACAQFYESTETVAIGVADAGIGIRNAISASYSPSTDKAAMELALTPGVTGTTARQGGTTDNAGVGLFYSRAFASQSRGQFVVASGSSLYKLLPGPRDRRSQLGYVQWHPEHEYHKWEQIPSYPGTVIGVDIPAYMDGTFDDLITGVHRAYSQANRRRRTQQYRRPRFA